MIDKTAHWDIVVVDNNIKLEPPPGCHAQN
jgi:hypothetical protein